MASFRDALEAFCDDRVRPGSVGPFSPDGVRAPPTTFPKSKALPGVFGVLEDAPNEANAPEPKPKAVEAPAVGDDTAAGDANGMALKGFDFPCDEVSPPNLFPGV